MSWGSESEKAEVCAWIYSLGDHSVAVPSGNCHDDQSQGHKQSTRELVDSNHITSFSDLRKGLERSFTAQDFFYSSIGSWGLLVAFPLASREEGLESKNQTFERGGGRAGGCRRRSAWNESMANRRGNR